MKVPPHVEYARRMKCPKCSANFLDPCAKCPHGRWEVHIFCHSAKPGPPPPPGPGTRLKRVLARLGFKPCERCGSMARKMDAKGTAWCRENIAEILESMRKSAADPKVNPLRLPFIKSLARRLILHALKD